MTTPRSPFVTRDGTPTGGVGWLLLALGFIWLMAVIGFAWCVDKVLTLLGVT